MIEVLILTLGLLASGLVILFSLLVAHAAIQEFRPDRIPALLYHRFRRKEIGDALAANNDSSYVSYDTGFAAQMQFLKSKGFTPISLQNFLDFQQGRRQPPRKAILITFDDGFMSNYLYAFPILKKHRFTATIFVTPDPNSKNFLKNAPQDRPLTHQQMKEMSDHGISMQSHGMTHRYLSVLEPEIVRWELAESKKVLEEILEKPVQFLAIPSGAYSRGVREVAREVGYKAVFCMLKGSNNLSSDPYKLRRVVIGRDFGISDFKRVISPMGACQLRVTSFLQQLLLELFGPRLTDILRNRLVKSRLGSVLVFSQNTYLGGGALALVVLILGIIAVKLIGRL